MALFVLTVLLSFPQLRFMQFHCFAKARHHFMVISRSTKLLVLTGPCAVWVTSPIFPTDLNGSVSISLLLRSSHKSFSGDAASGGNRDKKKGLHLIQ